MILLSNPILPETVQQKLASYQSALDGIEDFAEKVRTAKARFSACNIKKNATFKAVKVSLREMCSGASRCCYCEDSAADEVEHIRPKTLYPESTFVWENYLYACGPCNGPKSNRFAIYHAATGQETDITPGQAVPPTPPEPGEPLLINPRLENGLDFLTLDLLDTFEFVPDNDLPPRDFRRAEYTIDLLGLNRDMLLVARREAFEAYCARLSEYVTARAKGRSDDHLVRLSLALRRAQHPTVWAEIKRWHPLLPMVAELFESAPEALGW